MSKTWYPVIDYSLCTECGKCTSFCRHQVYDKAKAPTPVVVFPEGCVHGCHGCGKLCPAGAISYIGDHAAVAAKCTCDCGEGPKDCCS